MTQEEIIKKVIAFLNLMRSGASIAQEPYKSDLFNLFKNAYKNGYFERSSSPCLTGEALTDIVIAQWVDDEEKPERKERLKLIQRLVPKWDEWRYAWDKYDL